MDSKLSQHSLILGHLLNLQSTIVTLPSEKAIVQSVENSIKTIPGVRNSWFCAKQGGILPTKVHSKTCGTCLKSHPITANYSPATCLLSEEADYQTYPMKTLARVYGYLVIKAVKDDDFAFYGTYIKNIASSVAILFENLWQKEQLNSSLQQMRTRQQQLELEVQQRTEAEKSLRQTQRSFSKAQEIAHLGNWDWDMSTNSLAWSDEIFRIFGLQPDQFVPTYEAFLNTIHPDDRNNVIAAVNDAVEGAAPYSIVHRVVQPDGSIRYVHEQGFIDYDENKKPVHMTGTVLDITDRRHNALQLESALRQQRELLHILCHDLLNPISGAHSMARLMLSAEIPNPKRALGLIESSLKSGIDLINFNKERMALEEGKFNFEVHPLDITTSIQQSITLLMLRFEQKEVKIEYSPDQPIQIIAEENSLLNSVLNNLLTNALKFSYPDSTVFIRCRIEEETAVVEIEDQGTGIPPALLPELFNTNKPTSTKGTANEKGTGFGMPLVKNFMEYYGGSIEIHSQHIENHPDSHGTQILLRFRLA